MPYSSGSSPGLAVVAASLGRGALGGEAGFAHGVCLLANENGPIRGRPLKRYRGYRSPPTSGPKLETSRSKTLETLPTGLMQPWWDRPAQGLKREGLLKL